jgi:hypothetical protein
MGSLDEVARAAQAGEIQIDMRTEDQRKRMFALWNEVGFGGDENRATRLDLTAKFVGVERIESSNDLTRDQADVVIAKLLARKAQIEAEAVAPDA